jgi:hypothetical protein
MGMQNRAHIWMYIKKIGGYVYFTTICMMGKPGVRIGTALK